MNGQQVPASVDGVHVSWGEAAAANLANWEDRAALHVEAYNLAALREDPRHLSSVVAEDLPVLHRFVPGGTLAGLDVCHLQCHIGTDTVSLARAGGRLVGVDFSPTALGAARELSAELGLAADFVETDVLRAKEAVDSALGRDARFDVVYTSIGTVTWLNDLDTWAEQVAGLLTPGGVFYFRDGHPILYALDEHREELVLGYRYFGDGSALQWDDEGTYAGDGTVSHTRTYEWPHPVSELVMALLNAGLELIFMDEGRSLPWKFSELMEVDGDSYALPEPLGSRVPLTVTLVARKPLDA